jgi:hypothetical protein
MRKKQVRVVADSGLMNKTNIALLKSGGYKYIGARIKNVSEADFLYTTKETQCIASL